MAIHSRHSRQYPSQRGWPRVVSASLQNKWSKIGERIELHSIHFAALHGGKNTAGGHYVCHVKKEGRWCIFNDEKVAERS